MNMKQPEFTATEIAEVLAKANDLVLADHSAMHHRIKYLAKKELLVPTRRLDARGTLAFGPLEPFRAAVFVELLGMAMDARAFEPVNAATMQHFEGDELAPSQKVGSGYRSGGALKDAVKGVAAGEPWFLKLWRMNPGLQLNEGEWEPAPESIRAAFVYGDKPLWSDKVDAAFMRKPTRTVLSIDLQACFAPLIDLIGVPE
jgi:hypothetical protein